jgi:23S rRNA (guanosine2251-2'-O)-methyltransferase
MSSPSAGPSDRYRERKSTFDRCLTLYGRNTVLEALQCPQVRCERLHLAESNRQAPVLDTLLDLARAQGATVLQHTRASLARISRNGREDQGVAADVRWDGYAQLADLLPMPAVDGNFLIAVDGVQNPQNLGMLIRSAAAGGCYGILLPRSGGCDISPLVIKASAGALFRAPILRCATLDEALRALGTCGWRIGVLAADGAIGLFDAVDTRARVFVLGGETSGVSAAVRALADETWRVPMENGIESLNVAVAAALVAYRHRFARR